MVDWDIGRVVNIVEETGEIQIVIVKHSNGKSRAINYLQFQEALSIGHKVIINKTAKTLNLGSGGYDFIVTPINLTNTRRIKVIAEEGHIMKLRYTPYQFSVLSAEEQDSKHHDIFKEVKFLEGMPVIIGELHSMLPVVVTVFRQLEIKYQTERKKIVYIMTDGAALPISFSNHVRRLQEIGWLDNTITIGQSFGGNLEAVNIYTGLIAAKYIFMADVAIVIMGPGITGTGTVFGHTGIEQGVIANAAASLKGLPVSIIRAGTNDKRQRHHGISHHTLTTLTYVTLVKSVIPYPGHIEKNFPGIYQVLEDNFRKKHELKKVFLEHQEVKDHLKKYPYPITTMGRTIEEDPLFFDFVAGSAYWLFNYYN